MDLRLQDYQVVSPFNHLDRSFWIDLSAVEVAEWQRLCVSQHLSGCHHGRMNGPLRGGNCGKMGGAVWRA
jgi:hypothetical protein